MLVRTTTWYLSNCERFSPRLSRKHPLAFISNPIPHGDSGFIPGRLVDANGGVCVELGDPGCGDLVTGLADILGVQEELGGEIRDGGRRWIVEGKALDASKGDILGDFDTETLEADDEHVRRAHALHGLMAEDIQLSAVEGFVDFGRAHDRLVDLHPGDEVNLAGLLRALQVHR